MTRLVTKKNEAKVVKIASKSKDCRFLQMESGKVVDLLLTTEIITSKDVDSATHILTVAGISILVNDEQLNALVEPVQQNFLVDEQLERIVESEYVESGSLTICILTDNLGNKFSGEFFDHSDGDSTAEERRETAYSAACCKAMEFFVKSHQSELALIGGNDEKV